MSTPWIILTAGSWAVLVLLVVMVLGLARQLAELHIAIQALTSAAKPSVPSTEFEPGGPLPELRGFTPVPRPALFLFLSSSCAPCQDLAIDLQAAGGRPGWTQHFSKGEIETVLVTDERGAAKYQDLALDQVLVQKDGDIARALGVSVTPYGVMADTEGILRAGRVVNSLSDMRTLLDAAQALPPQQLALVRPG
jgi:hypothetical protein